MRETTLCSKMKYLYQQTVRLDEEIANKLRKSANKNKRSMNSEIIAILEAYFVGQNELSPREIANKLRVFADAIDKKE